MQFSVGDRVVHPHHGPGRITGVERRELLDDVKRYYEIEIPTRELLVHLPTESAEELGLRPAVSRTRLPRVLARLRSQPRHLPLDYKQPQEEAWERLRTGRVMHVAEVVRDLTWHDKLHHLTKKDTDYLAQARNRLAAEMALVCGAEISDMEQTIKDELSCAIMNVEAPEQS